MLDKSGGIRVPVWIVSVVVAALLGWAGSWIGYSVVSDAKMDARVAVLETKAEATEADKKDLKEISLKVARIETIVTWLATRSGWTPDPARQGVPRP